MNISDNLYNDRINTICNKQNMSYSQMFQEITQIELKPSILLMSGGLDTTLLLYMLHEENVPLHVLSFDYGQEAVKEINYAHKHCNKLNVTHEVIVLEGGELSGNLGHGKDIIHDDPILVPARNQVFISIGVSYALQHGYERVYYGATKGANPSYMDCSPEFVHQFNLLNLISDLKIVQIRAPLLQYTKQEIIDMLLERNIDLRDTWSCYANGEKPCGECSSCKDRKNFETEVKNNYSKKTFSLNRMLDSYS